jgi:Winged helix DNA-binding domain
MSARFTWPEVCARRLARHCLLDDGAVATDVSADRIADVVAAISGAHAQMMSAAEVSIGIRLRGATRADVHEALWAKRSLIKTYGPRGTVHLLPTRDLPMWTGALSAIPSPPTSLPESARLTPAQFDAVIIAIAGAVRGAELTIDELDEAVVAATGGWASDQVVPAFGDYWPRWRQALSVAAHRGVLCFGPNRGRRVTYTDPAAWLPKFRPATSMVAGSSAAGSIAAAGELARRYLYAYGPATPNEFARWLGAPRDWALGVFGSIGASLERAEIVDDGATPAVDDRAAGDVPGIIKGDTGTPDGPAGGLMLLPYFDPYGVGCHPRRRLFPGRAYERALNRGAAGPYAVMLLDGTVAGIWHQSMSGRRIRIVVEPFVELSAARRRELDDEVARIGAIRDGEAELTIGTVTAGPHA